MVALLGILGCPLQEEPCAICPPEHQPSIVLDTEYVECAEVRIRVAITDSLGASDCRIVRDGAIIFSGRAPATDTVITDDGVAPSRTYHYRGYRLQGGRIVDSSAMMAVTTMDTTSHDFTWAIDTLGVGGSSILWDVSVINDSLAYVVGEMYLKDSTGRLERYPHNVARWDGKRWQFLKVLGRDWGGNTFYTALKAVHGFAPNDVWFTNAADLIHWDGSSFTSRAFFMVSIPFDGQVLKMWGSSRSNLYCVGRNGAIFHYDDNSNAWEKMVSGTDVDLLDVWGTPDGSTVWACGWVDFKPTVLLRLRNGVWEKVFEDPEPFYFRGDSLSGIISSVWVPDARRLFLAASFGLYKTDATSLSASKRSSFTTEALPFFPFRLRGTSPSDAFIVGENSMVAHFNGYSWRLYTELLEGDGRIYSADAHGGLVIAVGRLYDPINRKGIVYRGRRQFR